MLKSYLAQAALEASEKEVEAKVLEGVKPEGSEEIVAEVDEKVYGADLELGIESIHEMTVVAELELQEIASASEEATTLEASMESIAAYAQSALADGGLRPEAAELVLNVHANLTEGYEGLRGDNFGELSTESIYADGGQLQATEYAVESISSTIDKIIKAAKRLVEAAFKATLKFYDQHLSLGGRVTKNANKLIEALGKVKGTPEKDKLSFASMEFLFAEGKMQSEKFVVDGFKLPIKEGKAVVKEVIAVRKIIEGANVENIATFKNDLELAEKSLVSKLVDSFVATGKSDPKVIKELGLSDKYTDCITTETYPGDRTIHLCTGAEVASIFKFAVGDTSKNPEEVPALGLAEIKAKAEAALVLTGLHAELVSEGRQVTEAGKTLMEAMAKKGKELAKAEGITATQLDEFQTSVAFVKQLTGLLRFPYVQTAKVVAATANSYVQYANKSRKNLVKPKEDKK